MVDTVVDSPMNKTRVSIPALRRQSDHLNSKVNTVNAVSTSARSIRCRIVSGVTPEIS